MSASEQSPARTPGHLSVGEVAAEAGVAPSAVRFYERHGLIVASRTSTNQRRFDTDASCRIKVAKVAQRVGLTVREIAEILEPIGPGAGAAQWEPVATQLVAEAERRIVALRTALDDLSSGGRLCEIDDRATDPSQSAPTSTSGAPSAT